MRCRRCHSTRLLLLNKKLVKDNDVFRCQECGFLFSPADGPGADAKGPAAEPSRTVTVRSGYPGRV